MRKLVLLLPLALVAVYFTVRGELEPASATAPARTPGEGSAGDSPVELASPGRPPSQAPRREALDAGESRAGESASRGPTRLTSFLHEVLEPIQTGPPTRLFGRVVLRGSGSGVPDLPLTFEPIDAPEHEATTDAEGRFSLEAALPAGVVEIYVEEDPLARELSLGEASVWLLEEHLGGEKELRLEAVAPALVVRARVVDFEGEPAPDCSVVISYRGPEDADMDWEASDDDGRAQFTFYEPQDWSAVQLWAMGKNAASRTVSLELPIGEGPTLLELEPSGRVRVEVVDPQGSPIPGVPLVLRAVHDHGARGLHQQNRTRGQGRAEFHPLPPGEYRLFSWRHPEIREDLVVEVGAITRLRFELEHAATVAPAVSGRVVDEDGKPLGDVQLEVRTGHTGDWISTQSDGSFSHRALPTETVVVSTLGAIGDRYQPEEIEVPFGTTDVQFVRVEEVPTRSLSLEIVDRHTGEGIVDSEFCIYLKRDWTAALWWNAEWERMSALEFKVRPDANWMAYAPGYRRQRGSMPELLERLGEGDKLRLELVRGYEHRFRVRDDDAGLLDNVRVLLDGVEVGRTGADGEVWLELAEWPERLEFELAGYELGEFEPFLGWDDFEPSEVWIEPEEEDE